LVLSGVQVLQEEEGALSQESSTDEQAASLLDAPENFTLEHHTTTTAAEARQVYTSASASQDVTTSASTSDSYATLAPDSSITVHMDAGEVTVVGAGAVADAVKQAMLVAGAMESAVGTANSDATRGIRVLKDSA
jgi:hypothetical protein